ncbi:UDP-forming cellulose synthase catalytic subunit [Acuticoccus sp. MNP-M23]|uniref:UDP-forming cellulose synthase catalytic subunit n=1 Tax=Acuticoccus sp. MNP-M23 TaxID=3072793 RepID=UPI0028166739|nr:UDP-forming cellulose synthase catalytic subunit [Acuticoccus sp. MNP-M23]WMS43698.1 UDP-forming cellulose synthase catalytic subunit [Acuticoccus sp. MNP-M23]
MRFLVLLLWLFVAAILVFMVTQPVSLDTHFVTSMVIVVIIAILKMFDRKGALRAVVLALGTAVVLRYIYWRTFTTIPPVEELGNFIPGVLLYIAEMYSVVMLFLSLFVVADPLDRTRKVLSKDSPRPTVDVFVPSVNESPQLLATTLSAAKQMDYPADKLTVYLLDDGGTDERTESADPERAAAAQERRRELQQLARDLGVNYLTRSANINAKAGNLNNGLAHSTGEFVVVFDADHAPTRDFLTETLGYFYDDPRMFLVQTPHFFINPDPLEHNLETWNRMPSENEMFYGIIQKGLDKWNGTFFCGSAAVLRRTALEEVGGFSGRSITEDAETSVNLHAQGWNSAFVDRPMIAGLQPETFANFIGQRSRWCQGMMQILLLNSPLFKSGLSIPQRICYMSSMFYWLFPFSRLVFAFAPLFYLFFGLSIFDASGAEFAAYTVTYLLVNILMQNYLWNRVRWPFISELYETIQSVYLIRALGSVIVNPTKPTFKVTTKGETNRTSRISELGGPFYVIFFILTAGVVATIWRLIAQPFAADVTLVVGGWNLFNILLFGAALGVVAERRQLRSSQRVSIDRPAEIIYGDRVIPAKIDDVSIAGARILVPANVLRQIKPGEQIIMRFQPLSPLASNELPLTVRSVVRDEGGVALGSEFSVVDPRQYELVADLVFANSDEWVRFQNRRRKNIGAIRGIVEFLSLAVFQTVRGLSYLFTAAPGSRRGKESAPTSAQQTIAPAAKPEPPRSRYIGADPDAVVSSGAGSTAALHGVPVTRSANSRPDR